MADDSNAELDEEADYPPSVINRRTSLRSKMPSVLGIEENSLEDSHSIVRLRGYPNTALTQLWVLFARRYQVIFSMVQVQYEMIFSNSYVVELRIKL